MPQSVGHFSHLPSPLPFLSQLLFFFIPPSCTLPLFGYCSIAKAIAVCSIAKVLGEYTYPSFVSFFFTTAFIVVMDVLALTWTYLFIIFSINTNKNKKGKLPSSINIYSEIILLHPLQKCALHLP